MAPAGAVRSGKWKLIEWYEKSLTGCEDVAFELFDLENDIGETVNLTDSLRSVKDDLYSMLNKWREEVNAQMPVLQK
jgi:arylsulfatase A-like enzyme